MSDKKTLPVRIHEGFMEIGRFDHVAVYSGLIHKQRNSPGISVSTPTKGCLSPVLDYAGGVQAGSDLHRRLAALLSHLTLLVSSTSRGGS